MQGVVRNLQILLEQSKLWKGELAQLPSGPVRRRSFRRGAARGAHLSECRMAWQSMDVTAWVSFMVKLLRAYGGCLGARRR